MRCYHIFSKHILMFTISTTFYRRPCKAGVDMIPQMTRLIDDPLVIRPLAMFLCQLLISLLKVMLIVACVGQWLLGSEHSDLCWLTGLKKTFKIALNICTIVFARHSKGKDHSICKVHERQAGFRIYLVLT